eukprot:Polyplicarium_translucidae@DN1992_c0_g1_i5.p2
MGANAVHSLVPMYALRGSATGCHSNSTIKSPLGCRKSDANSVARKSAQPTVAPVALQHRATWFGLVSELVSADGADGAILPPKSTAVKPPNGTPVGRTFVTHRDKWSGVPAPSNSILIFTSSSQKFTHTEESAPLRSGAAGTFHSTL